MAETHLGGGGGCLRGGVGGCVVLKQPYTAGSAHPEGP